MEREEVGRYVIVAQGEPPLLLHVRTRVRNGEWEGTFRTWYPGFRPLPSAELETAQPPAFWCSPYTLVV